MPRIENIFFGQGVPGPYGRNRTSIGDNNMFYRRTFEPLRTCLERTQVANLVSIEVIILKKILVFEVRGIIFAHASKIGEPSKSSFNV
ncbi:hypothetical protein [Wolbachia endosymbiont of Cantharis cryptica]|uniref:hypothetical protein n=1 Tax=Wolbachia endosymbiont of Cantharis cryptica TaxID=3066132 RepID=UPI00376F27E5